MPNAEIVALLAAGDVRGLEAAYGAYADRIHDYARGLLRAAGPEAAADVVHDTFLIALAKGGTIRDPERLRPWLYAVARNECLRVLRATKRSEPLTYDDGTPNPAVSAAEAEGSTDMATGLSKDDLRELVHAAAAGLSPKDREVFDLGMRHDLAAAEIGRALGVADNAAHAMLSRVRTQFSRALGALVVARQGRGQCADLDGLLRAWDGAFDPLWRKRIARHVDDCTTCTGVQGREMSAAALLSVVPIAIAPLLLRDRLFGVDPASLVAQANELADRAGPFDADGFPEPLEGWAPDVDDDRDGSDGSGAGSDGSAGPPTAVLPVLPVLAPAAPAPPEEKKRRRGLIVAAALLLFLGGGGTAWVLADQSGPGGDPRSAASGPPAPVLAPAPGPQESNTPAPTVQLGDETDPAGAPDTDDVPDVGTPPDPASDPEPAPEPAPEPQGVPGPGRSPQPTTPPAGEPTSDPTPAPAGTLRLLPNALTLAPGASGTIRLIAVSGPVTWTSTRTGGAARFVSLSQSSGTLEAGEAVTITVRLSSNVRRPVTSYVVDFGPGAKRLTITVDHPPIPG